MGKISGILKKRNSPSPVELDNQPEDDRKNLDSTEPVTNAKPPQKPIHSLRKIQPQTNKNHSPSKWDERLSLAIEDNRITENFRMLRSKILHSAKGEQIQTILIASTEAQEGKSFVTANLAIAIAQDVKQHALMVNCDLRRPSLANLFGFDQPNGLTEYLRDGTDLSELILHTGLPDLTLLPSGHPPSNPAELLTSEKMADLITELKSRYNDRLILLDSPPVLAAAETTVLAQNVDKIILVVRWSRAGRESIKKCVETIGEEKILGVVFNAFDMNILDKKVQGMGYYNYYPSIV